MWREIKNKVFLSLGFAILGLGLVGIFIPLLPTTPFVLLAAWFLARSNKRYHEWLRSNRYFGDTLRGWEAGEGLTKKAKWRMVILATVFIGISFFVCPNPVGRVMMVLVWPIPVAIAVFARTRG
ncbi:hypothetical protein CEE37_05330 [candidate division LCP-89 bacterium B3_LCP]|uniref:DUF454 domain-containing protein n=1 Tax=candidate division LCP-89 bacterium B3_LCP TaxID=2012998 RepID=A0A532V1K0_UNCL8|nr:MAG: hypothetical protein CEE37_05330 [candidate division LCP-89 bacterium B3_LCP]